MAVRPSCAAPRSRSARDRGARKRFDPLLAQYRIDRVKRGLAAPLLFLALILAGRGSVEASPLVWTAALACLWAGAVSIPRQHRSSLTPLSICVAALAVWIVGANLFANPAYNSAAQYQAAFLLGGFLYGRRVGSAELVYRTALALGVALAAWVLWQQCMGEFRPRGPFVTPATLATVVNLLLAPGLVLVAFGLRPRVVVIVLGVLTAALAASTSRGGWLALAGGLLVALPFLHRIRARPSPADVAMVGGLLLCGSLAAWALSELAGTTSLRDLTSGLQAGTSFQARLELYALAFTGIQPSTWLTGAGYGAFYYLLDTGRGSVPSYTASMTYFVHNDYLQMLYEHGVPGLLGLLLLVVTPFATSWRVISQLAREEQRTAIAILAAIGTMALQAIVDFPFFIPLCMLMYGIALGLLDRALQPAIHEAESSARSALVLPDTVRRGLIAAAATITVCILAVPAAAEAAADYAHRQWRNADGERAAFWFEAARRIDAADWRYHWYAGQFWMALAEQRTDPAAARLADTAFAAAVSANRRDARPLYSRIQLHSRLRRLLAMPADAGTLRRWADQTTALAPTDQGLWAQRERIYRQFPAPGQP
jgi:O-antigen ligase